MAISTTRFTVPFRQLGLSDIACVGGKNASLGELVGSLSVIRALASGAPDGNGTSLREAARAMAAPR